MFGHFCSIEEICGFSGEKNVCFIEEVFFQVELVTEFI